MWTYLLKNDIDGYLDKYPILSDEFKMLWLFETKDAIFLPRLMFYNFPHPKLIQYHGKKIVEAGKANFKFTGKLRPDQIPIMDTVFNMFNRQGHVNGIVKARPGIGKTVMAVYAAAKIGLKTIIIVDNSSLMEQWIKEIYDFTDLTIDDIGMVKQRLTVTNKPVTIAMCQSLLSKIKGDLKTAFEFIDESKFGFAVYDEVHNTSASEMFAKVSLLFRTPNIMGLSATPFQYGMQEILMKNTIGEVIYETNEYETVPKYYMVMYKSGLDQLDGGKYFRKMTKIPDYLMRRAIYNKIVIQSQEYIRLITTYTRNLLKNGHVIIIICFTKKQVEFISEKLSAIGIDNRRYYGGENDSLDKENDNVLVVTYSYAGKGFNMKRLSALIYATPLAGKKSIIQTTGRVLRGGENKNEPVIIDLIDMSFQFMFLKDIKKKTKIVNEEFDIPVLEHKEY